MGRQAARRQDELWNGEQASVDSIPAGQGHLAVHLQLGGALVDAFSSWALAAAAADGSGPHR